MAALGEEREGAGLLVPPVPPDEGVREVPVEDALGVVDGHDVADGAARDHITDLDRRREVPNYHIIEVVNTRATQQYNGNLQ